MKSTARIANMRGASGSGQNGSGRRPRALLATLVLAICALALTAAPALAAPEASTPILSNPSYASVHVEGEADVPVGNLFVEYSTDQVHWLVGYERFSEAGGPFSYQADLTHLKGGTTYFVRAVSSPFFEAGATSPEPNPEFTTLPVDPPAVVSINDASDVLYNVAKASGRVRRPEGNANAAFDVDCHFEYVSDASFQPVNEQQNLTVRATGGTFTLSFAGQTTAPIAFDAAAATVQSALESLSSVGAGNLNVSGGPGDETGTSPYTITFGGSLAAKDVEQIGVDPGALTVEGEAGAEVQTSAAGHPEGFNDPSSAPCKPVNPVTTQGESDVTGKLIGLAPGTTYHLRLHGENAGGTDTKVAADTFTTLSSPPAPGVQIDPVTTATDSSAHLSGKIDTHGAITSWHFQCTPACGEPAGSLDGDSAEDEVNADVSGLEPNTTYEVELVASGEGGQGEGAVTFKTAFLAPLTQTGFAKDVEATTATLTGKVNPYNSEVTYSFEYGTTESYGAATPAATLGEIDNAKHDVSQGLEGLAEDTTYHFRLTATNGEPGGAAYGEDHTFTTQTAAGPKACPNEQLRAENNSLALPDCRAYEQVSALNKHAGRAGAPAGTRQYSLSSPDGNRVLFETFNPQGNAVRGVQSFTVGSRGPTGWSSEAAIPAGSSARIQSIIYVPKALYPSTDLAKSMFVIQTPMVPDYPPFEGGENAGEYSGLYLAGLSGDGAIEWLSHPQIPDSTYPPGAIPQAAFLRPIGASSDLSIVYFASIPTLLPEDDERGPGTFGLYEYSQSGLRSAATLPGGGLSAGGAIPANSSSDPGINNTVPAEYGNQVSRDGSDLWFVSPDPSHSPDPPQLYLRRGGHSTLVSHLPDGSPAPSGAVPVDGKFVYGAADGTNAIFQSNDALTGNAPTGNSLKAYRYDVATDSLTYLPGVGGSSVYAASDDASRFLFANNREIEVWDRGAIKHIATNTNPAFAPPFQARATATGSVFIFSTQRGIPGFNGGDHNQRQIYRYDLAQESLACVSCPPDSTIVTGSANFDNESVAGSDEGGAVPTGNLVANHPLSDDGRRVFFDSPDPLLPQDTNGKRDVYEWTPGGLSLISSGQSDVDSSFLDSSSDGSNVFFVTGEGLDPHDTDGVLDVYDARIDGGFAHASAVSPCLGNEVCKRGSNPPPAGPGPATNSFSGPGNPSPCPKGKVRKRGRCIKQKTRKHKHRQKNKRTAGHGRGGSK